MPRRPGPSSPPTAASAKELLRICLELLDAWGTLAGAGRPSFSSSLLAAGQRLDELCQYFEQSQIKSLKKSEQVLAVRVLERSIALGSALDAWLDASVGIAPMRASLHDSERILANVADAAGNAKYVDLARSLVTSEGRAKYSGLAWPLEARRRMLGATVSDLLDVAADLCELLHESPGLVLGPSARWDAASKLLNFEVTPRRSWPCGKLHDDAHAMRILGVRDRRALSHLRQRREVLSVVLWDGSRAYPQIQFVGRKVVRYLPEVLRSLRDDLDGWHVALWLGSVLPGQTNDVAYLLRSRQGYEAVHGWLDERELLKVRAATPVPFPTATQDQLDEAFRQGLWGSVGAVHGLDPEPGQRALAANQNVPASYKFKPRGTGTLYRVTGALHGPFYFSSVSEPSRTGGRFDLQDPGGTCYFSRHEEGAVGEVFHRSLLIDLEAIAARSMWTLHPLDGITKLLELTSPRTHEIAPFSTTLFTSGNRKLTQEFAARVETAGFGGIVHQLKSGSSMTGVALFGPRGRRSPEACSLGTWTSRSEPMGENSSFWSWVKKNATNGEANLFLNQIPNAL